jgi:hypothetical protein
MRVAFGTVIEPVKLLDVEVQPEAAPNARMVRIVGRRLRMNDFLSRRAAAEQSAACLPAAKRAARCNTATPVRFLA